MNYELRQYSFGETIGKGFNLYFNNFIAIVLVSLLCQIPTVFIAKLSNSVTSFADLSEIGGYLARLMGIMVLTIIAQGFLSAFIIHWVSQRFLEDSSTGGNNNITSLFPRIIPVIGLSIVVGLAVAFSTIALIVPGIIVALGFGVATEVMVIEKRKILESMDRSWNLTKGRKGSLFLIMLVAMLITVCINQGLLALLRLTPLNAELISYLDYAISAVTTPIQSCIMVVVYFNLRIEKEGFNIEHLARQFSLAEQPDPAAQA
jgi:hypothetical protein